MASPTEIQDQDQEYLDDPYYEEETGDADPNLGVADYEVKPLSDDELKQVAIGEIQQAIGGDSDSEISEQRRQSLSYYFGRPFGNEQVGRSQVILTDVADTVEWIMPSLMMMFFGPDVSVRYMPTGPGDEEGAEQASDYINHVFLHAEEGYLVGHDWFKTALMEKNSTVKVYYEELQIPEITNLEQITERMLQDLMTDDEIELVDMVMREDTLTQTDENTGEPYEAPTFDVTVRRVDLKRRIKVKAIPPEEFLISRDEIDMNDDTRFACHQVRVSASDLISAGIPDSIVLALPSDDTPEFGLERVERRTEEESYPVSTAERADAAARTFWMNDVTLRVDADGDGYTELRNLWIVGNGPSVMIKNEYVNFQPFATVVPVRTPHKFFGLSMADLVMDLQLIRSTLLRQMLDNVYLANNPRWEVVEGQVEISDLLTSLPGGVVRVEGPGMIKVLPTQPLPQETFQMMEMLEGVRENRTGITRYNQGLDAQSLNKTATGVTAIMEAANARIMMIADLFRQTGVKRLFKLLLRLMVEKPIKDQVVKMKGEWVDVDPSTWNPDWDVVVETGLGVGQQSQHMQMLYAMAEYQKSLAQAGLGGLLVTPKNAYNLAHELERSAGFRVSGRFFTDPQDKQPEPPPPDPIIVKAEMENEQKDKDREVEKLQLELKGLEMQQDVQSKKYDAELRAESERQRIASNERIATANIEAQIQRERIKADAQLAAAVENAKHHSSNGDARA